MGQHLFRFLLAVLGVLMTLGTANAHQTSLARATVDIEPRSVLFTLHVSAHDLAVAMGIPTDLKTPIPAPEFEREKNRIAAYVAQGLFGEFNDGPCVPGFSLGLGGLPEGVALRIRWECSDQIRTVLIDYRLFFEIDPSHRAVGTIRRPDGVDEEFVIDTSLNTIYLDELQAEPQSLFVRLLQLMWLGFEHILIGLDHILFLIVLIVGVPRWWPLLKTVTAFTLGHSITLALAWFDVFTLPADIVEPVIALSIVYVALENLIRNRPETYRWAVAGGFGLMHGLGFYNVLNALELSGGSAVLTLLGFNLGVELGQIVILVACLPIMPMLLKNATYRPVMRVISSGILIVALYWVVERVFL